MKHWTVNNSVSAQALNSLLDEISAAEGQVFAILPNSSEPGLFTVISFTAGPEKAESSALRREAIEEFVFMGPDSARTQNELLENFKNEYAGNPKGLNVDLLTLKLKGILTPYRLAPEGGRAGRPRTVWVHYTGLKNWEEKHQSGEGAWVYGPETGNWKFMEAVRRLGIIDEIAGEIL